MKKFILGFAVLTTAFMNAQTQIIAHRGYFQTQPPTTENSITALQNAQKLKIYGSEFDVRMSKDGVLVINHDEHHGKMEISETDFKELAKLKLLNGEKYPTLKDYLKAGKKDKALKLIVEIKPAKTEALENELVEKTIAMIKDMKLESQCEYISFSLNICKQIKKIAPDFKVQYLRGELSPQQIKEEGLDGLDYHYSVFQKNPTWISEANALGLITNSWTVNDVETYNELKKQGVKFVTTNIPDQLKNK
ncbi:glycerophosphodiester phosphodiesterase family protein [Chryseobacterium indoltheticum]|uniref:Cytoplasmic glycerophosphodiester phosphodiesterase n=1 Tax=Chryseobacterium indoltheticum TaxID=254 RepID=A0A381FB21_9FLAO|nr:glycerophosphodiester phosphodiesterase family protein [Chryseobacterium indoltheticum]AZA73640.1 glycerophosphodiester phosphodiesterase [Chryseobacterium indoltheticum]SIR22065.1 glycerophosphoryl diester phosphodiesterase [Chryseobacterium indoltheticum]SUX43668.1 cytoplasmic glycerophosphodiester phosphodiesterase [Chryseobacterium indoltheticum]